MSKQIIVPKGSAPPLAPYSSAVMAGGMLYISGTLALDVNGHVVGAGDIKVQARAVLESIKNAVETAGGNLVDIVMNTIILKDMSDYGAANEVYAEYFPEAPPARYCIRADLVRPEFLIEIASIAHFEN